MSWESVGHLDWHAEADALSGQDLAPSTDQLLIGLAHGTDLSVQIIQSQRIYPQVLLTQSGVPVHLVRKGIPGEADNGDSVVANSQHIGPFLPEPGNRLISLRSLAQV